jgi:hypothetical protein
MLRDVFWLMLVKLGFIIKISAFCPQRVSKDFI